MPQTDVEYLVMEINDVDMTNRSVFARDKTGALVQVSFRSQTGMTQIPAQGELWTCVRRGYTWHLENKLDSKDDHSILSSMAPGDARLASAGAMQVQTQSMYVNSRPIGATVLDHFSQSTPFSSVTLTTTPSGTETIQPSLNGVLLSPDLWSYDVNSRVLLFYAPLGYGNLLVRYETWRPLMDDAGTVTGRAVISGTEELALLPASVDHSKALGTPTI